MLSILLLAVLRFAHVCTCGLHSGGGGICMGGTAQAACIPAVRRVYFLLRAIEGATAVMRCNVPVSLADMQLATAVMRRADMTHDALMMHALLLHAAQMRHFARLQTS